MQTPYEEDKAETDPLESRWFYELMQSYRHDKSDGLDRFNDVKQFIRNYFYTVRPEHPDWCACCICRGIDPNSKPITLNNKVFT